MHFFVVFRVPRRKVPVNSMQQGSSGGATCLMVTRGSEDPGVNKWQPFWGGSNWMQMYGNFERVLPYNSALFGFLECLHNMFLIGCKCLTAFLNSS